MSRGIAGSLIPSGRALEIGKGGMGSGTGATAAQTPLAPTGFIQGTPDWWLATLPGQKGVRVVDRFFENGYNASGVDETVAFIDVADAETLILLRYRFFAVLPDTGGRRQLASEVDLSGAVIPRLTVNSMDIMEYTFAKTENGFGVWHDRLHDGVEPIPLYVTGKNRLRFQYTVRSAPSFTVSTIGFYMTGAIVPTKTMDDIIKR